VPHGGFHLEVLGKEAADGAGLRGALNDDEGVTHRQVDDRFPLYRTTRPEVADQEGREQRRYSHAQQTLALEPL